MKIFSKIFKGVLIILAPLTFIVSCNEDDATPPPEASFTVSDTPVVTQAVTFTNSSTNSTEYVWDFGDGETSTDENPSHIYTTGGSYNVKLTATGKSGEDMVSETINVVDLPTASFSVPEGTLYDVIPVEFSSTSNGADSFLWSFGDSEGTTSIEENPSFIYDEFGNFSVTLEVKNAAGVHSTSVEITIVELPLPVALFSVGGTLIVGETIEFTNESTGADSYLWSFGDDGMSNSTDDNPSFSYSIEGTYTVNLEATNAAGASNFSEDIIVCSDCLAGIYNISTVTPAEFSSSCPAGHEFTGTIQIIYDGDGLYSFNDWSFGTYLECYGTGQNLSGTFNFEYDGTVVTINNGDDQFGDPVEFSSVINGNDWIITWNNVGSYSNEQGVATIIFPNGVPFTVN